ncbi:WYL domain-containing protein [Synergistaceae bacterium OttesenSCG-928-I11]|nr:WYL domain-containing protein [Synergistaceae bacterium OttesenSCG-928-I11]
MSVGEYVTGRTLEKDLEYLRDTYMAEVVFNRKIKKYELKDAGVFLLNLEASKREVQALAAGLRMSAHFLPHLKKHADSLWEKLKIHIPSDLAEWGEDLARSTVIATPIEAVSADILEALIDAKHKKTAIAIEYASPNKTSEYVVSPYDIYFRGHAWYMASFSHRHGKLGTHRISRVKNVSETDEPFVRQEHEDDARNYVASAWYCSSGDGEARYHVKVRALPALAASLRGIQWHPTQQIEEEPDGSIVISADVPALEEVARWVLASAPGVRVVEPEGLAKLVRKYANCFE